MRSAEKVNLNILKIKNEQITHQQNPQEISIEESTFSEAVDFKACNFPKDKPPKRHSSQSLLKREKDRLNITSFVSTSNRGIIWITESKKNTVEIENRN